MIGRTHRFHGYGSLRSVYQRGQTVRGSMVSLRFSRRDRRHAYRVAVVVSRKVHKSAVVRNRIRRRIYEVVRQEDVAITAGFEPTIPPGTDLVFTVFSDQVATFDTVKLHNTITDLTRKTAAHQQPQ